MVKILFTVIFLVLFALISLFIGYGICYSNIVNQLLECNFSKEKKILILNYKKLHICVTVKKVVSDD